MKATMIAACVALMAPALVVQAAFAETKLTVGIAPIAETEAVFAAQDEGFFQQNGLDVSLVRVGMTAVSAIVGGSVAISSVPTSSFLQAADQGLDVVLVSSCGVTDPRTAKSVALIARTGVAIDKPGDVAGKKIGVPGVGGLLDVLFERWLTQKGVNPDSMTRVEVQIPNTVDVLRAGSVDGIVAGEPFVSRAVNAGVGKVAANFMSDMPSGIPYSVMVSTRDWVKANPDPVAAFRKAVAAGAEFGRTQPAKMQEINAKYTGMPLDVVRQVELPECRTVPDAKALDWLIGAMRDQHALTNALEAEKLIAR
jgi:NitT/TauT family transport system substrate-binding protein